MINNVPFFRPDVGQPEIDEVVETLRSGWLTSGPRVKRFEKEFADAVGAEHAIAVNSCTAALHLAVEALKLKTDEAVLVPTMTFAATAEVVRYLGATPILVDCDPVTANMNLADAEAKLLQLRSGQLNGAISATTKVVGIIPVHVGGLMLNIAEIKAFAAKHGLWVVEDAAHALPSAWRADPAAAWQRCGEDTADISCFSFYANKTITTGEGGMATTNNSELADRLRLMSLHGLSHDAWDRYRENGSWDYRIVAPGFKYNLTDIAAAIGLHQLARADEMQRQRQAIADRYLAELSDLEQVELPPVDFDRHHAWHLFPLRLRLEKLRIDRNVFIEELKRARVGCSVHWRPLHLHPYYEEVFGWKPEQFPVATNLWKRLISLPIFPGMTDAEIDFVIRVVKKICQQNAQTSIAYQPSASLSDVPGPQYVS